MLILVQGAFLPLELLSVAKGMKISKNINLYGFKNSDLKQFDLAILTFDRYDLIQNKLLNQYI